MTDTAKIIERVKKLLAVTTERGATEGEQENAMRAAQQLLAAHGLSRIDAENAAGSRPVAGVSEVLTDVKFKRPPAWIRRLAMVVAAGFECQSGTFKFPGGEESFYVVGMEADASVAAWLFVRLKEELESRSRAEADLWCRRGGKRTTFRRRFHDGATIVIQQRLAAARRATRESVPRSGALAVRKGDAIEQYNRENKVSPRDIPQPTRGAGMQAGMAAGWDVSIDPEGIEGRGERGEGRERASLFPLPS